MKAQLDYDPAEDRLLLRLTMKHGSRAFWLTRRMTGLLWRVLWRRAEAGIPAGATAAARAWLLALGHENAATKFPPTREATIEPTLPSVLVTTLKHGPLAEGHHRLGLLDDRGNGEMLALDADALHALIRLVGEVAGRAGWGLKLLPAMPLPAGLAPEAMRQ